MRVTGAGFSFAINTTVNRRVVSNAATDEKPRISPVCDHTGRPTSCRRTMPNPYPSFSNVHRPHSALNYQPPASRLPARL